MTEENKEKKVKTEKAESLNKPKTAEKAETEKKKKQKSDIEETIKKELEATKDLLLRTAAEFDNYKKRTEKERLSTVEYAKASVIKLLLPVIDNIERANGANKDSEDYIKGIEMIVKQLSSLNEKLGIVPLVKEGDTFDPSLAEAVMHKEDETLGENVITKVLQQGYKIGDTVIRHAMVEVTN